MALHIHIPLPSNSFRPEYTSRPAGFHTPPPPAAEPLSPIPLFYGGSYTQPQLGTKKRKLDGLEDHYSSDSLPLSQASAGGTRAGYSHIPNQPPSIQSTAHHTPHTPPSALDVFATVATSPSVAQTSFSPPTYYPAQLQHSLPADSTSGAGRPRKRARSEQKRTNRNSHPSSIPSTSRLIDANALQIGTVPIAAQTNPNAALVHDEPRQRPSSSSLVGNDNSVEEAELLLSFARNAKFHDSHHHHQYQPYSAGVLSPPAFVNGDHAPYDRMLIANSRSAWEQQDGRSDHTAEYMYEQKNGLLHRRDHIGEEEQPNHTGQAYDTAVTGQSDLLEQKPKRVHRGWPKGKPRGTRATGANSKPGRKSRKTQSATTDAKRASQTGSRKKAAAKEEHLLPQADLPPRPKSSGEIENVYKSELTSWHDNRRHTSVPRDVLMTLPSDVATSARTKAKKNQVQTSTCAACEMKSATTGIHELWISCNGCKSWFHSLCVGFNSERELRDVDKFYCSNCETTHGKTTFVRKSSRAHASVDYAGLNQGEIRTSTDTPDHHYIQLFKEGSIEFQPETFARMPPELVTASFFEKSGTMSEPVLIPASLNPRPRLPPIDGEAEDPAASVAEDTGPLQNYFDTDIDYDAVPDDGQDKLDMVMPQGLTVRRVAELYGRDEKLEVIDVKSQEGGDNRWTMSKWADYYEAKGEKPVRNVISLEVSQSKLGRMIRRPKVVRDLDLQDAVWPRDELDTGKYPQVQFYCLMSVADCYTDFHVDFGGSSVYYHILRGKKTFFFIPPKKQHLKKYEEWCTSANQSAVFLGSLTKECYRVDLSEGDTMLIPSGWIHAVWTPEDSLVIGGNFLTRMHYGMQIQINEIEKNTGVGRRFRYPSFQKVLWYAVIQYLQEDPVPSTVAELLYNGERFERLIPVWLETEAADPPEDPATEHFNARYYSQGEIEGLADLLRFVFRTVMISLGKIQGIAKTTQEAVVRSLPKGYGEHLDILKTFALWAAWKRGNEDLPLWAHPDTPASEIEAAPIEKKPTATQIKKMEREASKGSKAPERRSQRQAPAKEEVANQLPAISKEEDQDVTVPAPAMSAPKRLACEACRQRRIRCKHRTTDDASTTALSRFGVKLVGRHAEPPRPSSPVPPEPMEGVHMTFPTSDEPPYGLPVAVVIEQKAEFQMQPASPVDGNPGAFSNQTRIKACDECRKSKRRCVHDANGNVDPLKAMQAPVPRAFSVSKKSRTEGDADAPTPNQMKNEVTGDSPDAVEFTRHAQSDVNEQERNANHVQETPVPASDGFSRRHWLNGSMDESNPNLEHTVPGNPLEDFLQGKGSFSDAYGQSQALDGLPRHQGEVRASSGIDEYGRRQSPAEQELQSKSTQEQPFSIPEVKDEAVSPTISRDRQTPATSVDDHQQSKPSPDGQSDANAIPQDSVTENVAMSLSPPASSRAEFSPSSAEVPQENGIEGKTLQIAKRTSRTRHQVERFVTTPPDSRGATDPITPKPARDTLVSPAKSARRPSTSKRSTASGSSVSSANKVAMSGSPAEGRSKSRTLSGTEEAMDEEADENMKLARKLQEEEFGLRRRSKQQP